MITNTTSNMINRLLLGFFRFTNLGSATLYNLIG